MGKEARKAGLAATGLLAALLVACFGSRAEDQEVSDRTVELLMKYAWQLTPHTFVTPQGKKITVDKSQRARLAIPSDTAREVIRAARMSAQAQICGLAEEQLANFQTLMRRQQAKGRWSEQQMLYLNQLHLFTVMALTGTVAVVDEKGALKEGEKPAKTCNDSERARVRQRIMAYVNADPASAPPGK
jgi:hypothetical protein